MDGRGRLLVVCTARPDERNEHDVAIHNQPAPLQRFGRKHKCADKRTVIRLLDVGSAGRGSGSMERRCDGGRRLLVVCVRGGRRAKRAQRSGPQPTAPLQAFSRRRRPPLVLCTAALPAATSIGIAIHNNASSSSHFGHDGHRADKRTVIRLSAVRSAGGGSGSMERLCDGRCRLLVLCVCGSGRAKRARRSGRQPTALLQPIQRQAPLCKQTGHQLACRLLEVVASLVGGSDYATDADGHWCSAPPPLPDATSMGVAIHNNARSSRHFGHNG